METFMSKRTAIAKLFSLSRKPNRFFQLILAFDHLSQNHVYSGQVYKKPESTSVSTPKTSESNLKISSDLGSTDLSNSNIPAMEIAEAKSLLSVSMIDEGSTFPSQTLTDTHLPAVVKTCECQSPRWRAIVDMAKGLIDEYHAVKRNLNFALLQVEEWEKASRLAEEQYLNLLHDRRVEEELLKKGIAEREHEWKEAVDKCRLECEQEVDAKEQYFALTLANVEERVARLDENIAMLTSLCKQKDKQLQLLAEELRLKEDVLREVGLNAAANGWRIDSEHRDFY